MKYEFKPSFDRSIKALQAEQKDQVKSACLAFLDLLENQTALPVGTGLKKLRNDFWEIRHGLRIRIIFRWQHNLVEFILAGDHNSIKNFLKGH